VVSSGVLEPPAPGTRPEKNIVVPAPGIESAQKFEKSKNVERIAGSFIKKSQFFEGV